MLDLKNKLPQDIQKLYKTLVDGQSPHTLFITCADSRINPNLLMDAKPGELFLLRNVGNLIPIYHDDKIEAGHSTYSAIEYAITQLDIKNIIICGHSNCGAINALCTMKECPPKKVQNSIESWLQHACDCHHVELEKDCERREDIDLLSQKNVLKQIEHLKTHPLVKELYAKKEISLKGIWFDMRNLNLLSYDENANKFIYSQDDNTR